MKLILSLTAVFTLVANIALAAPPSVHARELICPSDLSHAVPLLRADKVKADHVYSTNSKQIADLVKNSGYTANGSVGRIFTTREPATDPLYRLYNPALTDHAYTTNILQKDKLQKLGYHSEGIAGYVLHDDLCGFDGYHAVPLYRFYSSKETAHLLTTDVHGQPAGYKADASGSTGFILVQSF